MAGCTSRGAGHPAASARQPALFSAPRTTPLRAQALPGLPCCNTAAAAAPPHTSAMHFFCRRGRAAGVEERHLRQRLWPVARQSGLEQEPVGQPLLSRLAAHHLLGLPGDGHVSRLEGAAAGPCPAVRPPLLVAAARHPLCLLLGCLVAQAAQFLIMLCSSTPPLQRPGWHGHSRGQPAARARRHGPAAHAGPVGQRVSAPGCV